MMKWIAIAAWAALLAAQDADKVDNEEYERWSKVKVGSEVKFKITSDVEGRKDSYVVYLLRIIDKEQATVSKTFGVLIGRQMQTTKSDRIVPAKVFKGQDSDGRVGKEVAKGDEAIDVLGKKVQCSWVEREYVQMRGTVEVKSREKTWYTSAVVGGVARFEVKSLTHGTTTRYQVEESKPAK